MTRPEIPAEGRLEIQELFAYYAWGLNTGDAQQVLACFADDCTFEHQPQGIFRGHDQMRVLPDHLWYAKPGWFIGRQHLADNVCTKAGGEWLLKSVRVVKWMGDDGPWEGEDRAKQQAPTGSLQ